MTVQRAGRHVSDFPKIDKLPDHPDREVVFLGIAAPCLPTSDQSAAAAMLARVISGVALGVPLVLSLLSPRHYGPYTDTGAAGVLWRDTEEGVLKRVQQRRRRREVLPHPCLCN